MPKMSERERLEKVRGDLPLEKWAFYQWVVSLPCTDTPRGDFIRDTQDVLKGMTPIERLMANACKEAVIERGLLYEVWRGDTMYDAYYFPEPYTDEEDDDDGDRLF